MKEVGSALLTICENIISKPDNQKFRHLKPQNQSLRVPETTL